MKAKALAKVAAAFTTVLVSAFVSASLVSYFLSPAMRWPLPRLAIISNGGGPAVMATDALIEGGG